MQHRLFVGGIQDTTEQELRAYFEQMGYAVLDSRVMKEMTTLKNRGFGFVTVETNKGLEETLRDSSRGKLKGKTPTVNVATARRPKPQPVSQ